jgi:hypothetical protein
MRRSNAIRIAVLCTLLAVLFIVFSHRISVGRIGIVKDSSPYCRLELAKATESDIVVRITVANPTEAPIGVYKWNLPTWNNVSTSLFQVDRDGRKIEFHGRYVDSRVQPGDMLQIEAGTSASVMISLQSAGYDVKGHGKFDIMYITAVWSGGRGIPCPSNTLVSQK